MNYILAKLSPSTPMSFKERDSKDYFVYSDLKYYFEQGGVINELRFELNRNNLVFLGSKTYLDAILSTNPTFLNVAIEFKEGTSLEFLNSLKRKKMFQKRNLKELLEISLKLEPKVSKYILFFNKTCSNSEKKNIIGKINLLYSNNSKYDNKERKALKIKFSNNNQAVEFSGFFNSLLEDKEWVFNFHDFLTDLHTFKKLRTLNGKKILSILEF